MNLKNLKFQLPSSDELLKKHLSGVLWVFLLIVAALVGYVVFKEVRKFTQVNVDNSGITGQIVRTDMSGHDALTQTLQNYSGFVPRAISGNSVFNTLPPEASSSN